MIPPDLIIRIKFSLHWFCFFLQKYRTMKRSYDVDCISVSRQRCPLPRTCYIYTCYYGDVILPSPPKETCTVEGGCCLSIQNPRRPLYIVEKTLTFHAHAMNSFLTLSRGAKSKNISINPQLAAEQTKVHVRVLLTWS